MGNQERGRGLSRLRRGRLLAASGGRQAGGRNRGVSCRGPGRKRPEATVLWLHKDAPAWECGGGPMAATGEAPRKAWASGAEWRAHGRNGWLRVRACAPGGGGDRLVLCGWRVGRGRM